MNIITKTHKFVPREVAPLIEADIQRIDPDTSFCPTPTGGNNDIRGWVENDRNPSHQQTRKVDYDIVSMLRSKWGKYEWE